MKAALLAEDGTVHIDAVPDAVGDDSTAVVRIAAAGVCGTELHFLDGLLRPSAYPFIMGHESAGVVERAPTSSSVQVGDRVAIYNMIGCGECPYCRTSQEELCDRPNGQIGFNVDGGFAEFVAVPVTNLIPIADNVSFETAAALSCSGMTAVHAVRLAQVGLGDTAVINGVGGVGLMVLQAARLAGATTLAIGDSEAKLDLAREAGASHTILVDSNDDYEQVPDRVRAATNARGGDAYFELVGTEQTMRAGVRSLAKAGKFVSIGYTDEELRISPVELILGERQILSSVAAAKRDLITALDLAAAGRLDATIDTCYPLDEIETALTRLRNREVNGRNMIVFEL
jgi:propanol-preferring alcohol dehydrogenase